MKIVELKCPSCGANLKINSDLDSYTCNFCGTTSLLDEKTIKIEYKYDSNKEERLDVVKNLIEDGRFGSASDRLSKLSEDFPSEPRIWKYYILILTNNLMEPFNPRIDLEEYKIYTKNDTLSIDTLINLYNKYETDEEEKYKIMSAYNLLLDKYNKDKLMIETVDNYIDENFDSAFSTGNMINNVSVLSMDDDDPLYNEIYEYVITQDSISASIIQRKYRLGYNRAAHIIDTLEERGVIGPANGSNPREVLIHYDD